MQHVPCFRDDPCLQVRHPLPHALGIAVAALIAGYHFLLIRGRERMRCFKAFLHNNWFGASVVAGIVADYGLRHPKWPL